MMMKKLVTEINGLICSSLLKLELHGLQNLVLCLALLPQYLKQSHLGESILSIIGLLSMLMTRF